MATIYEVQQSALQKWIEDLPLANPAKVLELTYNKLADLPITQVKPIEGYQLLSLLKPLIKFLNEVLQQHYLEKELSPLQIGRETSLCISLLTRYASSYAVLFSSSSPDDELPETAIPLPAACLHHACYYLSLVLMISSQLYLVPPEQLWLRLHKLYLQAENNGYLHLEIPHTVDEPKNIHQAYLVSLLLAAAGTNQLRPIDVIKLYAALLKWSDYAKIENTLSENTIITLQLDKDAPPSYQVLNPIEQKSQFTRALDLTNLIMHIQAIFKQHLDTYETRRNPLPSSALNNIIKSWSNFSDRIIQRNPQTSTIKITIGLTATHVHVGGNNFFMSLITSSQDPKETTPVLVNETNIPSRDAWENIGAEAAVSVSKYPLYEWRVINSSPQGYCLQVNTEQLSHLLEPGELLGLYHNKSNIWRLSIIRWIKKLNDQHYHLGVMFLSPDLIPAAVQLLRNSSPRFYRAFILPETMDAQRKSTILIPALDLNEEDQLKVVSKDSSSKIKLTEPVYLNDKIYEFKYEVLPAFAADSDPDDKKNPENIWNLIK